MSKIIAREIVKTNINALTTMLIVRGFKRGGSSDYVSDFICVSSVNNAQEQSIFKTQHMQHLLVSSCVLICIFATAYHEILHFEPDI